MVTSKKTMVAQPNTKQAGWYGYDDVNSTVTIVIVLVVSLTWRQNEKSMCASSLAYPKMSQTLIQNHKRQMPKS
jgi:hypothetical protein